MKIKLSVYLIGVILGLVIFELLNEQFRLSDSIAAGSKQSGEKLEDVLGSDQLPQGLTFTGFDTSGKIEPSLHIEGINEQALSDAIGDLGPIDYFQLDAYLAIKKSGVYKIKTFCIAS